MLLLELFYTMGQELNLTATHCIGHSFNLNESFSWDFSCIIVFGEVPCDMQVLKSSCSVLEPDENTCGNTLHSGLGTLFTTNLCELQTF
ncbi:hypothetical protein PL2TA16_00807 [Pseudoalteromonas luteoviolacea 2ta16]|uniref:Uncharacterized protein n=1 Tax=Pseudoalteromonas luteoviolacea (strain 2ta16) TaxID=1353533 RepID=V4JIW7_PSEL2|nr:hypothetical protein PL2TA16_00807 [Pseudoalteromonas luteoviolacea 2ta16]